MRNHIATLMFAMCGLCCLVLLPLRSAAGESAKVVELELRDSAVVSKSKYTLRDVIVPEGSRGWQAMKLGASDLGNSPRPTQVAHITRTQIAARLEALFPGIQGSIRWKGASTVKVRTVGVSLLAERLVEAARTYLERELSKTFKQFAVKPVQTSRDIIVPKGKVELQASLGGRQRAGKRTCVWVDISVGGRHYQTEPVWFEVESFQTVWVVSVDREKHEYLDATVLKQARRDVALLPEAPLGLGASLDGMRLTKTVVSGQVLTRSMVEAIPAVEKGELVTVHAQSGHVRLRTRAIALSDGDLSQKIPVQNTNHGEAYTAVVVGRGEVTVNGK